MTKGREVVASLLLIVAFFILQFNPVSLSFSTTTVIGLLLVGIFGALVTVGGMIELPWYYTLPVAALSVVDITALGLFLFALFGSKAADREEENMIAPSVMRICSAAFAGYSFFVLAAVASAYPLIDFHIPAAVSGYAVQLLVPSIGCELDYTGQECVESLVSSTIDRQCKGDPNCIRLLNENRDTMEENTLKELQGSFPGFDTQKTVREILQEAMNMQVTQMIEPYRDLFKFLMAFVIFTAFQVLASPMILVSTAISKLTLWLMERANLLTKRLIKVEKLRFSA